MRYVTVLLVATALLATSCSSGTSETTADSQSDVQPLTLVVFGDSLLRYPSAERGVVGAYVEMLEEEFGVPVDVWIPLKQYGSCSRLVTVLGSEREQVDFAGADVIILENPVIELERLVFIPAGAPELPQGAGPVDCGGNDQEQCMRDVVAEHNDNVEAIFAALTAAVDPSETLIRAVDVYVPFVEDQLASGTLEIASPYWQEAQELFAETAAAYGIPVARVFDEFMGPGGIDDPQTRGLVTSDQMHPTEAGVRLIADLIGGLGYDLAD